MSGDAKYPIQFAFVGTQTQKDRLIAEAKRRRSSVANVVRRAVDARYGLDDGEEPEVEAPE